MMSYTRKYRRSGWPVWLTSLAFLGFATDTLAQDDTIPSVTLTCDTCSSESQLRAVAQSYLNLWGMLRPTGFPVGKFVRPCYYYRDTPIGEPQEAWFANCTVAVVASKLYPLTGIYEYSEDYNGSAVLSSMTPSDLFARDKDNEIIARSGGMPPLELPTGVDPGSEFEATILAAVDTQLVMGPPPNIATDLWHGLLNQGQFTKVKFMNAQTLQAHWVYVGDNITIKYPNGWTEKLKLICATCTIKWQRVEGSLRDANGRDPNNSYPSTSQATHGNQTVDSTIGGHSFVFVMAPVVYSQPASRLIRQGVVIIIEGMTQDTLLLE